MKFKSKSGEKVEIVLDCRIAFYPAGGGFQRTMLAGDFFEQFTQDLEDDPYRAVKVEIDGCGRTYWAYSNGKRWNGWACPYFEMDQVREMAQEMHGSFTYHEEIDTWAVALEEGDDDVYIFSSEIIEVDGQPVKVFGIGAGSWCWDETEGETK